MAGLMGVNPRSPSRVLKLGLRFFHPADSVFLAGASRQRSDPSRRGGWCLGGSDRSLCSPVAKQDRHVLAMDDGRFWTIRVLVVEGV